VALQEVHKGNQIIHPSSSYVVFVPLVKTVRHVLHTVTQPAATSRRTGNLNSHFFVLSFCSFKSDEVAEIAH
jgi:hypothetical protein